MSRRRSAHGGRDPSAALASQRSDWTELSLLRLVGAALGFPVQYFTPSIEPELQAELINDDERNTWGSGVADDLKTCWRNAVNALRKLREARDLIGAKTSLAVVLCVVAEKDAVMKLFELQSLAYKHGLLLCSQRGEAGETIAHLACLYHLHDVLLLLLDMEPMLIACKYTGEKYKGETLLHSEKWAYIGGGFRPMPHAIGLPVPSHVTRFPFSFVCTSLQCFVAWATR
jgi:hypothetical protein